VLDYPLPGVRAQPHPPSKGRVGIHRRFSTLAWEQTYAWYMFIHIVKDEPKNKKKHQGEAQRNTMISKDSSKATQRYTRRPKRHPRITTGAHWTPKGGPKDLKACQKGAPQDPQSQPKGSIKPPRGTLGTTFGPHGNRSAEQIKTTKFLRSLFERFRGQLRMQSPPGCAVRMPKITTYSSCIFETLVKQTMELNLEMCRGLPGPQTEEGKPEKIRLPSTGHVLSTPLSQGPVGTAKVSKYPPPGLCPQAHHPRDA